MPLWVRMATGTLWAAVSAYFWLHHEWQALVGLGIGAVLGMVGSGIRWLAETRKSWHEGSLAKEQRKRLLQEQEDEEKLAGVVREMDEVETALRREQNLHGWIDLDALEDIFAERLPLIDRRLIRKGIAQLKQKKKERNELWAK